MRGGYAVAITIVGVSLFDYCMQIKGMRLSLAESLAPFPVWIVFYVIGVLKAQRIQPPVRTSKPLCWAIGGIVLCCCQIAWFYHLSGTFAYGVKLSTQVYSYFVVCWLFSDQARKVYNRISNMRFSAAVSVFGRWSFFVYLTHTLWTWGVLSPYFNLLNSALRTLCQRSFGLAPSSQLQLLLNWGMGWIMCIVISFLFAACFDKLCPVKLKRYIGF